MYILYERGYSALSLTFPARVYPSATHIIYTKPRSPSQNTRPRYFLVFQRENSRGHLMPVITAANLRRGRRDVACAHTFVKRSALNFPGLNPSPPPTGVRRLVREDFPPPLASCRVARSRAALLPS